MKKMSYKNFPKIPPIENTKIICGKANIKSRSRLDLAIIIFNRLANVAYVTTKSKTFAANIKWLKENKNISKVKVLMVNSGNANAYTGEQGYLNLKSIIKFLSHVFNCKNKEVIISSTGVIGEQLPINKIMTTLNKLTEKLIEKKNMNWESFARSIMTTDTFPKGIYKKSRIGNKEVKLIGIAKGSGMIAPDMATMLGYIFTDADFSSKVLQGLLMEVNEKSFNSITVDSDMSTNDMVCFFSTRKISNTVKTIKDKMLDNKVNLIGRENFSLIQRQILVQVLDQQWKAHLLALDQLRQGIGLRAYAQRDPLNEYKRESFTMFEEMLETVRITACRFIMLIEIETKSEETHKGKSIRERLRKKIN